MEVTGKIRLKRDLNLTTLTCPDVSRDSFGPTLSSGPQRKDDDNEGEDCKEAREEGR
jgi:hypothetical protein